MTHWEVIQGADRVLILKSGVGMMRSITEMCPPMCTAYEVQVAGAMKV